MIKTFYESKGWKLNDTASIAELILIEYVMREHKWSELMLDRDRMSHIDSMFDIYSMFFSNPFPTGLRAYLMTQGYKPASCHNNEHLETKVPVLFENVEELDKLTRRLKKITMSVKVPSNWVGYYVYQEQSVKFLETLPDCMTVAFTATKPITFSELCSMYTKDLEMKSLVIVGNDIIDSELVIGPRTDVVDKESATNGYTVLTGSFQNVNIKYKGTSPLVLKNCKIKGTLSLPINGNVVIIGHSTIDASKNDSSPIVVGGNSNIIIQGENLKLIAPKGYSCLSNNTSYSRLGEQSLLKCRINLESLFAHSGVPITFGIYGSTISTYNIQCNVRKGKLPRGVPTKNKMFRTKDARSMDYVEVKCE